MYQGGNITLEYLLTKFPDDRAWNIAKDLKFTALRSMSGKSGNVANINIRDDADWAQNLKDLISKFKANGLMFTMHEMGTPWKAAFGIVAPYFNYRPTGNLGGVPTPIPEALEMVDQLGGDNDLSHNFLTDLTIPYWQVINEAPLSNPDVRNWTASVADRIRGHGGKVTGSLKGDSVPYADFRPVIDFAEDHFDYLQAHEYFYYPETLDLLEAEGTSAEIYQTVYNKAIERIGLMLSTRGSFPVDRIIIGEWGIKHGEFKPPGVNKTYQVTDKQQADYIAAVFDAMKEMGFRNQYYHLVFDDPTETWGIVDPTGLPHLEQNNAFKKGVNSILGGDGLTKIKNEGDTPLTVIYVVEETLAPGEEKEFPCTRLVIK